jgi:hypothetical protein
MLIGEQQLSWLTAASSDKDRDKCIDQTIRIAVAVFLQGCSSGQGSATDQGSASAASGGTKRNGARSRPPARKRPVVRKS